MPPDLRTTQKRYLEKIALVRRPNTVINSRTATNGFIRYLESEHPEVSSFREFQRRQLEGWFRHLARRPLKKSTRRNAIIKVRVFLGPQQRVLPIMTQQACLQARSGTHYRLLSTLDVYTQGHDTLHSKRSLAIPPSLNTNPS